MIDLHQQKAMQKAKDLGLAAQVERVRFGVYRVPSTSQPGVWWIVRVERGVYSCTCKAGHHPACVHRAAVYLAKIGQCGARVIDVKPAAAAPAQESILEPWKGRGARRVALA